MAVSNYFNNFEAFKKHLKHIGILTDFFNYCHKLKIFNINALMRIVEDKSVSEALLMRHPVVYMHPNSRASKGFKLLANKLIG